MTPEVNWEVVEWLRSPEGEKWSELRMQPGRSIMGGGLNNYGNPHWLNMPGMFSIKPQSYT